MKTMKTFTLLVLIVCASLAFGQSATSSMTCTDRPGHSICTFADGSVVETLSTAAGHSRFEWTAEEWRCNQKTHTPAAFESCLSAPQHFSTATRVDACLSGQAHDRCLDIETSCKGGAKVYSKSQCAQVLSYLDSRGKNR